MRACQHGLLELSTVGQGRIKYMTTLQTRACPLVLPVFLSETWHWALPELLNKHATCNNSLTSYFESTPKLQNDLLNHYLGQGKSSIPAGIYQVLCAAFHHH